MDELTGNRHKPPNAISGARHAVQLLPVGPLHATHDAAHGEHTPSELAYVPLAGQLATHVANSTCI
jgi:hypothetical protein